MSPSVASSREPTFSICVSTYNYGRFLTDAIESVLQQDLEDFELIITDDASTDDTRDIVERYAREDSRVRYILNEK